MIILNSLNSHSQKLQTKLQQRTLTHSNIGRKFGKIFGYMTDLKVLMSIRRKAFGWIIYYLQHSNFAPPTNYLNVFCAQKLFIYPTSKLHIFEHLFRPIVSMALWPPGSHGLLWPPGSHGFMIEKIRLITRIYKTMCKRQMSLYTKINKNQNTPLQTVSSVDSSGDSAIWK